MRWLITADWQAEWENLDLCAQAWAQCLEICDRLGIMHIAFLGDLKRPYNPVDVRIVQFWQHVVADANYHGRETHFVLGNHDRVGMYDDAQNWLSIFERSGAHCYDKPTVLSSSGIGILPFNTQVSAWKKGAATLRQSDIKLLFFHQDLDGAYFNVGAQRSDSKYSPKDIQLPGCIALGGHIHKRQEVVKNVWYVGSPFCTDWGEANQKKSFAVYIDGKLSFIPSNIPGWYDPTWAGFRPPTDWKGSRIRIHVPCPLGSDLTKALVAGRLAAEKQYPGAIVQVVPKIEAPQEQEEIIIRTEDPDEKKVAAYVDQSLPEDLQSQKGAVRAYLLYKLRKASGGKLLRHGNKVRFLWGTGKEFLTYPNLTVDYRNQGLVVITGKNLDWAGGRSNGTGKTNLLSLLPVGLFGSTFKEQKFDAWARRDENEKAWVDIAFEDSHGHRIVVHRGRRPSALRLLVNDRDASSGMGALPSADTQKLIEQSSGFTWDTFANSVYIDQKAVSSFLRGTQKEKKSILERFQNLERFVAAKALVTEDLARLDRALVDLNGGQIILQEKISNCNYVLKDMSKDAAENERTYHLRADAAKATYLDLEGRYKGAEKSYKVRWQELAQAYDAVLQKKSRVLSDIAEITGKIALVRKEIQHKLFLAKAKMCSVCGSQVSPQVVMAEVAALRQGCGAAVLRLSTLQATVDHVQAEETKKYNALKDYESRRLQLQVRVADAKNDYVREFRLWSDSVQAAKKEQALRKKWVVRKMQYEGQLLRLQHAEEGYADDRRRLMYCETAFSRQGIPAFLNAQLVPILNKAADYYSELFCDQYLQVRFVAENGEFDVQVLNAFGGDAVADQSAGEEKMAALVTVFSLREVAPQSNILILDEPGEGLDPQNARFFAAGLKKLKSRFETIFLTTHNPYILAELSGEKVLAIEKKNRTSRVL